MGIDFQKSRSVLRLTLLIKVKLKCLVNNKSLHLLNKSLQKGKAFENAFKEALRVKRKLSGLEKNFRLILNYFINPIFQIFR